VAKTPSERTRAWRKRHPAKYAALSRQNNERYVAKHGVSKGTKFYRELSRKNPALRLWKSAAYRARKTGLPFDITVEDILVPSHCPVFGVKLVAEIGDQGHRGPTLYSPSLDRHDPSLGYVKGNVVVMSHRANLLKSNASIEELEAVLAYLRAAKK